MSSLILTPQQISVSLENKNGELRLDSRIVADGFGIKNHTDYRRQLLEKYELELSELGVVFKTTLENGEIVWHLNQAQVNFAGTLARNTEKAVKFKLNLVKAFELAKQIIPALSEKLEIARLDNESLKLQLELQSRQDARIALHGLTTTLLLEGKSDAVIEIEKPTLEVIDQRNNTSYSGQTLTQIKDFLLKKHGIKFKTGADIKHILEQKGLSHLIAQTPRSVLSDYVPTENQKSVYDALVGNPVRQMLIGE
jgi:phage regulator Rha-like protein